MQKSKEWFEIRRGKFTASEIYKLCAPKGFGITGEDYILHKAAEMECDAFQEINSKEMQWGIQYEPFAKQYYEAATGLAIVENDFDFMPGFETESGSSLDGKIIENVQNPYTIEFKCPYTIINHKRYSKFIKSNSDLKKIRPEYYWQMQHQFLCSGLNLGQFVSFHPYFKNGRQMSAVWITKDNEDCEFLIERLKKAIEIKHEYLK